MVTRTSEQSGWVGRKPLTGDDGLPHAEPVVLYPASAMPGLPLRVLIVERSLEDTAVLLQAFRQGGYDLHHERVDTAPAMRGALARQPWDLVISSNSPQFDSLAALAVLNDAAIDIPFIIVSGSIGEAQAVQAMRAGARDYLAKDHLARLIPVVSRELTEAKERLARREAERTVREREQQALLELAAAYEATVEGWSNALDLRDRETDGHSRRVTELTMRLARAMGVGDAECVHIRRGALLHDIGKMGVPDGILHKPAALTPAEWEIMRRHPTYAFELLSPIEYLRPALDIPYCHHERWDGSGYPRGLRGEEIPLAARIFAAVDIWDALRSDRPYRAAWSDRRTRDYLASLSGTHLDPGVTEAFLGLLASLAGSSETREGAAEVVSDRPHARILIVDDYAAIATLLERWLKADGYEVLTAHSGHEALAAVRLHHPDLVLLDIMIPEPDGVTVCRMIQSDPVTAMIPVIFMSGLETSAAQTSARALKVADYITKPIDVYELRTRVRRVLEQARDHAPDA